MEEVEDSLETKDPQKLISN